MGMLLKLAREASEEDDKEQGRVMNISTRWGSRRSQRGRFVPTR
jgi:hypothetical protein